MVITENLVIILGAYLATGVALVGYDLAAPPTKRKRYAVKLNLIIILAIWSMWPLTTLYYANKERLRGRSGLRFVFGVVLVAGGMYVWGDVVYSMADKFVGDMWVKAAIMLVILVLSAPVLTTIALPRQC